MRDLNNSPYQEDIIEQEYSKPTEKKSFMDSPELKRQVNTSKVIHTLLLKKWT